MEMMLYFLVPETGIAVISCAMFLALFWVGWGFGGRAMRVDGVVEDDFADIPGEVE